MNYMFRFTAASLSGTRVTWSLLFPSSYMWQTLVRIMLKVYLFHSNDLKIVTGIVSTWSLSQESTANPFFVKRQTAWSTAFFAVTLSVNAICTSPLLSVIVKPCF